VVKSPGERDRRGRKRSERGYQQSRVASALGFFVVGRRVVAAQKISRLKTFCLYYAFCSIAYTPLKKGDFCNFCGVLAVFCAILGYFLKI
jgi:hypothetical protein